MVQAIATLRARAYLFGSEEAKEGRPLLPPGEGRWPNLPNGYYHAAARGWKETREHLRQVGRNLDL